MSCCPTTCNGTPILTAFPLTACADVNMAPNKCALPGPNPLTTYEPGTVPKMQQPLRAYNLSSPPASLICPPPAWAYALYLQCGVKNLPIA